MALVCALLTFDVAAECPAAEEGAGTIDSAVIRITAESMVPAPSSAAGHSAATSKVSSAHTSANTAQVGKWLLTV